MATLLAALLPRALRRAPAPSGWLGERVTVDLVWRIAAGIAVGRVLRALSFSLSAADGEQPFRLLDVGVAPVTAT